MISPGRDLYMTTHNTHKRQTSMPQAGLEPANPASEKPQIHSLDWNKLHKIYIAQYNIGLV